MKCIRCQKELPDGAMYCKFCGQKQNLQKEPFPLTHKDQRNLQEKILNSVPSPPSFSESLSQSYAPPKPITPVAEAPATTQTAFISATDVFTPSQVSVSSEQCAAKRGQQEEKIDEQAFRHASSLHHPIQQEEKEFVDTAQKKWEPDFLGAVDDILAQNQPILSAEDKPTQPLFDLRQTLLEQDINQQSQPPAAPPCEQNDPLLSSYTKEQPSIVTTLKNEGPSQQRNPRSRYSSTDTSISGSRHKQTSKSVSPPHREFRRSRVFSIGWRVVLIVLEVEAIIYLYLRLF